MCSEKNKSGAAILTVGSEILCAEINDFNGCWLAKELHQLGVSVGIMLSLPDNERLVAAQVRGLARRYSPVIITGGIGTTHDDITRQAVARATHRPLELRRDVVELLEKAKGGPLSDTQRRLAQLPRDCGLIPNRIGRAPGFFVNSIYVFPGVPEMLRDMFPLVAEKFRSEPFHSRTLFSSRRESEFANLLEELSERHASVQIGSYPKQDEAGWHVQIILRSKDVDELTRAFDWLAEHLPGQPAA